MFIWGIFWGGNVVDDAGFASRGAFAGPIRRRSGRAVFFAEGGVEVIRGFRRTSRPTRVDHPKGTIGVMRRADACRCRRRRRCCCEHGKLRLTMSA